MNSAATSVSRVPFTRPLRLSDVRKSMSALMSALRMDPLRGAEAFSAAARDVMIVARIKQRQAAEWPMDRRAIIMEYLLTGL